MPPKNFVIVKKTPAEIAAAQEAREKEMREKAEKNRLEEEEKKKRQQAELYEKNKERLDAEKAAMEQREAERKEKLLSGGDINEPDWKKQQDKLTRQAEKEKAAEYARLSPSVAKTTSTASAAANQELVANAPKQNCIWGCKCPGYLQKEETAPQAIKAPPVCEHCQHAKSMHK